MKIQCSVISSKTKTFKGMRIVEIVVESSKTVSLSRFEIRGENNCHRKTSCPIKKSN